MSNDCETSVAATAQELLGTYLVRARGKRTVAYKIIEVEAYTGPDDKANHAHKGRTKRTEVMFGPAEHWYVYLCYGVHEMLNLVVGPEGYPAAILIRGVETSEGKRVHGPGRVTKLLGVDRRLNAQPADETSGLWVEDRGVCVQTKDIESTPRIGVGYAEEWVEKPLRFVLKEV